MKEANPIPQGKYVPARRAGNLIYTAGMTPRVNGVLLMSGAVKAEDDVAIYRDAVRQAAKNALTAARNTLAEGEKITAVMTMTVYVNACPGYTTHSKLADFASEFLCEELGDAGVTSRVSVGVESLPGNAPVEIQIIACCE